MSDALGGTVNIVIIVFFIVVVLGYMAFNVNYTKAFRMKNKIIAEYENYNGNCNSECEQKIAVYADSIGYKVDRTIDCSGYSRNPKGYCYKEVEVNRPSEGNSFDDLKRGKYLSVITKVNINIPVIDNVLNLSIFQIRGDSKIIYED